jgi:hypothetical protein
MADNQKTEFDRKLAALAAAAKEVKRIVDEDLPNFTEAQLVKRDSKLAEISQMVHEARYSIDPAKHDIIAISLGRPDALSRFFAFSFIERAKVGFETLADSKFYGSGVYALYYAGSDIQPYLPIAGTETPIYVGKAVPDDPSAETAFHQGLAIWKRLKDHRRSVVSGGINPADFRCRHVVIQSGMESAVEDFMIRLFKPIWNKEIKVCFGIGKHGDDAKTRVNKRSPWDTMHPGRKWADATSNDQASRDVIIQRIASHFAKNPPIGNKEAMYKLLAL